MIADIFRNTSLDAVSSSTVGSSFNTERLTRKTAFVSISGAVGSTDVTIQHSPDGNSWYDLKTTNYQGVNQLDDFSWDFNSPYSRVNTDWVSGGMVVSATITGRGI